MTGLGGGEAIAKMLQAAKRVVDALAGKAGPKASQDHHEFPHRIREGLERTTHNNEQLASELDRIGPAARTDRDTAAEAAHAAAEQGPVHEPDPTAAGNTPASPRDSGVVSGGPGGSEVTTGLGADVDGIVSLSPKSVKRIKDVQDAGWTIRLGPAGEGTRTHRASRVITIAEDSSAEHRASAVLHEVGHAHPESEHPPTVVTYSGEGRAAWAVKCAQPHFRDEGQAVFHEVEGLYEIADNGGPRILPASSKPQDYLDIYDQHLRGEMTKETAIHEMGQKYADERQSDGRSYRDRFVGVYEDVFDQNPMDEVFAEHGPFTVKVNWPGGDP